MLRRLAVLLVLVCAATVLLVPTSAWAGEVVPVVSEPFDTYDANLWDPHFYLWSGSSYSRSTGTTTLADGAISLRPTQTRGTSVLEARRSIVTTVPAHVSFKVRYQGTGYREADVELSPGATNSGFALPNPSIIWKVGNVGYASGRNPYLDVFERDGTAHSATQPGAATVIPSGTWLTGDLYLYPDRVTASFNGVTLTSYLDVASMVSPDGLRIVLDTVDDYSRQGLDVDEVLVEEMQPPGGHVKGTVRNATGQPLAGVLVSAWREPISPSGSIGLSTQTVTAADGSYDLTASVPGRYAVSYDDPSGAYRDQSFPACGLPLDRASAIPVETNETIDGIDATLTATAWLRANRAVRVSGSNRYDTALAVSRANFEHADTVVLATGAGYADASAAAPLCGAYRAPLLLTSRYSLPAGLVPELSRLGAENVIVIGSRNVVDDGVLTALGRAGYGTTRIGGSDRYETAAAVVRHLIDEGFELQDEPFVVRGDAFPDALSVSPFAYAQVRPVLLVRPDRVPSPTAAIFTELDADTVFIVGSEKAVGDSVLDAFAGLTGEGGVYYARIFGADRFATSEELVKVWEMPYDNLGIATGLDFPDALTGGIACGENRGGLLLSRPGGLSTAATGIISQNRLYLWPIQVYGSRSVVSDAVVSQSGFAAGSSFLEFDDLYEPLGLRTTAALPLARGDRSRRDSDPLVKLRKVDAAE